jgi:hypothetical protein
MPRPTFLSSPALSVLKFTPQEKNEARIGPDGLTEEQRSTAGKGAGPAKILALVERYYQAKIVDDSIARHIPRVRERVCVEGHDEVFLVIFVDRERALADMVSTERVGDLLECVPFSAIYAAEPPRAA